eukprot:11435312-Alexandrium_andersonii.AAC.1
MDGDRNFALPNELQTEVGNFLNIMEVWVPGWEALRRGRQQAGHDNQVMADLFYLQYFKMIKNIKKVSRNIENSLQRGHLPPILEAEPSARRGSSSTPSSSIMWARHSLVAEP